MAGKQRKIIRNSQSVQIKRTIKNNLAEQNNVTASFEAFLSMQDDLFFIVNEKGQILFAAPNSPQKLEYSEEEILKCSLSDLMPKEVKVNFFSELNRGENPLTRSFELPIKSKSGQLFSAALTFRPHRWQDQLAFAVKIKNTTVQKRLEVERSMLSHALKNVSECLSVFDLEGNVIFVNEAFAVTYNYSKEEIIGQNINRFHPSSNARNTFDQVIEQTLSASDWEGELLAKRKNGNTFMLALRTSPVVDEQGKPLVIIGVGRDVTEMKMMEEQLRQSQKMEAIGQLAGGIAHDFNNLLTVIEGYVELLLSSTMSSDPTHNFVQQIKKATERATSLTRQLLAFSRSQILQPKNIDLNELVSNMSGLLERLISENIELEIKLTPGLPAIRADRSQIEQILMNLAVNARDAMPDGGILTIETNAIYLDGQYIRMHNGVKKGQYIQLTVSDSGIGMDAETQKRIFEPFFTTKEKAKGTGLGLSTVYGIVKQSEGHIWVYSELGQGTSVKIYLPVSLKQIPKAKVSPPQENRLGGNETILVVEDEYLVRELVCDTLKNSGYSIIEASNGKEAVTIYNRNKKKINMVLTDVIMPEMSGRKLVEILAQNNHKLKALYMSGYTDDAIIRHGVLEPGMNYIQKPFSPRSLLAKIKEVLNKPL